MLRTLRTVWIRQRREGWLRTRIAAPALGLALMVAVALSIFLFGWDWKALIGWKALVHYIHPGDATERKEALQVYAIIVAGVVAAITAAVGLMNLRLTRKNLEQQRELEAQRGQGAALQAYYEQIGKLITDKDSDLLNTERKEIRELARGQTLTVLQGIDGKGKGRLLTFLHGAGLISEKPAVTLFDANLREADLKGTNLEGANLRDADLRGANLEGANLRGANLEGADLRGAYLKEAYLSGAANLRGANLKGAYLQGAYLRDADLQGANLEGAYLQRANLLNADLQDADLQGAYLQDADLETADLKGAWLQDAALSKDTDLQDADLRGAYLKGAYGVTNQFLNANTMLLGGATMPNGQEYEEWVKDNEESGGEDRENAGPS